MCHVPCVVCQLYAMDCGGPRAWCAGMGRGWPLAGCVGMTADRRVGASPTALWRACPCVSLDRFTSTQRLQILPKSALMACGAPTRASTRLSSESRRRLGMGWGTLNTGSPPFDRRHQPTVCSVPPTGRAVRCQCGQPAIPPGTMQHWRLQQVVVHVQPLRSRPIPTFEATAFSRTGMCV
jgi:hypothetical protein